MMSNAYEFIKLIKSCDVEGVKSMIEKYPDLINRKVAGDSWELILDALMGIRSNKLESNKLEEMIFPNLSKEDKSRCFRNRRRLFMEKLKNRCRFMEKLKNTD